MTNDEYIAKLKEVCVINGWNLKIDAEYSYFHAVLSFPCHSYIFCSKPYREKGDRLYFSVDDSYVFDGASYRLRYISKSAVGEKETRQLMSKNSSIIAKSLREKFAWVEKGYEIVLAHHNEAMKEKNDIRNNLEKLAFILKLDGPRGEKIGDGYSSLYKEGFLAEVFKEDVRLNIRCNISLAEKIAALFMKEKEVSL